MVALTDNLHKQLDQDRSVLLLPLDVTATFDMVGHNLLTHCLTNVGIWGILLKWLTSFFKGQGQRVELGERMYTRYPIICGVPQRAILSPKLLNIYTYPPHLTGVKFWAGMSPIH